MVVNKGVEAVFFSDTREVKCGNCGKKLFFLKKNGRKLSKSIDKTNYFAIINIKCARCGEENGLWI